MEKGAGEVGSDGGLEIIAHRGLHESDSIRENSRRAVLKAFESDADGIEVDLQLLGDGSLVLFHDETLRASDGTPQLLGSLTKREFRELVDHEPLFLEELLELDWQRKRIILECKPNRNHLSLVRRLLLKLPENAPSLPLTISSYDWDILSALAGRTDVNLAPVVTELTGRSRRQLKLERWSELHFSVDLLSSPRITDFAHHYDLIIWTVNHSERLEELERLGIKGIMTDDPNDF